MLITFEGIEGCGKSTQAALLANFLRQKGVKVCLSREPGGSSLGRELRRLLLDCSIKHLEPWAELFLYLADRAQHVQEIVRPALQSGQIVIIDRFVDSTLAYQGYARGLDLQELQKMNQLAADHLTPDKTIVLDLSAQTGLERAKIRNRQGGQDLEDRFEAQSLKFHCRVRQGYLDLASRQPSRIKVLDASGDEKQVFSRVLQALALSQNP